MRKRKKNEESSGWSPCGKVLGYFEFSNFCFTWLKYYLTQVQLFSILARLDSSSTWRRFSLTQVQLELIYAWLKILLESSSTWIQLDLNSTKKITKSTKSQRIFPKIIARKPQKNLRKNRTKRMWKQSNVISDEVNIL